MWEERQLNMTSVSEWWLFFEFAITIMHTWLHTKFATKQYALTTCTINYSFTAKNFSQRTRYLYFSGLTPKIPAAPFDQMTTRFCELTNKKILEWPNNPCNKMQHWPKYLCMQMTRKYAKMTTNFGKWP